MEVRLIPGAGGAPTRADSLAEVFARHFQMRKAAFPNQLQDLQCRTCEILFFVGLYCDKSKQKRLIKTSKLVLPILDVL